MQKNVEKIDPQIFSFLKTCPWPGNVRQLQNWIERAMTTTWKDRITLDNFYWIIDKKEAANRSNISIPDSQGVPLQQVLREMEIRIIRDTIQRCNGNKKIAAAELGISRQMLHRKIRQFGIQ